MLQQPINGKHRLFDAVVRITRTLGVRVLLETFHVSGMLPGCGDAAELLHRPALVPSTSSGVMEAARTSSLHAALQNVILTPAK